MIFSSWKLIGDALATSARILAGLGGAFVLGTLLALPMARSQTFERYAYPLLNFNQGIPALSWVVIAIIWFRGIEFRIFFIMVMTTLPAFTFQVLDAYRAMSKDLFEMTLAFRPTRRDLFRTLIWPTVLPGILTAWKVNLGNAARVVVVAELVGATGGVGYELLAAAAIVRHGGRDRLDAGAGDFRPRRAGRHFAHRDACAALSGVCGACAVSAPPEIEFEHVGKTFPALGRRRAVRGDPRSELHHRARRAGRHPRQDRLRQVDDVQPDLRPAFARRAAASRSRATIPTAISTGFAARSASSFRTTG